MSEDNQLPLATDEDVNTDSSEKDTDSSEDVTLMWVAVGIAIFALVLLLGAFIASMVNLRRSGSDSGLVVPEDSSTVSLYDARTRYF
jgi:hypothetical protein